MDTLNVAIYGASGYTGAELIRLLTLHPAVRITALSAESNAGRPMADVFPQFSALDLPMLQTLKELDLDPIDVLFCALPHGTTQTALKAALEAKPSLKVVDLSADFRLADPKDYAAWYGHKHLAPELQSEAVYGLVEVHRAAIAKARLTGNPGCYTTTVLLALVPLVAAQAIDVERIVIDAKSGMTGAGRAAKMGMLFSEVSEGFHAYSVGKHRHTAELDQELSIAAGRPVTPTFTPHLVPMNRGIYATIYADGDPMRLHTILADTYAEEPFVTVLPFGEVPQSRHVRGSNFTRIGVVPDRRAGKTIVISTLDNLVKGASGQAVQNMNVMCALPETTGLQQLALFP
ncbi:N-acetyl-gamma-glutamyl-phosphate reductase [Acuticoccus mangrovi]|uniref:N-acetyl-gamma-glutamyl-phosphate reductase n=1 Tax=Acuticoccus mangrovi TaxID=2796142 RepID=A0A934MF57_9HYPH|nr:N-acetyl-gamma-glutamyl-phosphate reductase [Acuticoccus mangrovi]MBJ3778302.1 N-acetyl-gamma-glutamyl-phosphate reductase [Acuticoccus mangrovi]